jgi:hypothetical protein
MSGDAVCTAASLRHALARSAPVQLVRRQFGLCLDMVPAPASLWLFVSGLLGLGLMCWRKTT